VGVAFDKECFFTIAYGQDGNMEKSPCQAPYCYLFTPNVPLFNIKFMLQAYVMYEYVA
jgi:hypothetical protein